MKNKFAFLSFSVLFVSVSAFAEVAIQATAPVAAASEDHGSTANAGGSSEVNVDSVFQKLKKNHAETIKSLTEAAQMLEKLMKEGDPPPNIVTSVALASEIIRLKREIPLIEAWDSGAIDKGEYVTIMAENLIVLDHLKRFAAFAKGAYSGWENREGPLNEKDFNATAAKEFDKFYSEKERKASVFNDVEVRDLAKDGRKTLPIYQATWAPDVEKRLEFRAKYYPGYAERLVKKNEGIIQEQRDVLEKSKQSPGASVTDGQ